MTSSSTHLNNSILSWNPLGLVERVEPAAETGFFDMLTLGTSVIYRALIFYTLLKGTDLSIFTMIRPLFTSSVGLYVFIFWTKLSDIHFRRLFFYVKLIISLFSHRWVLLTYVSFVNMRVHE